MNIEEKLRNMKPSDTPLLWLGYTLLGMMLLLGLPAQASDNEINLSQTGDNLTLTIVQKGENNLVQGLSGTGQLLGSNNLFFINQGYVGNNIIELAIDGYGNETIIGQEKVLTDSASGISWSNDTNSYGYHHAKVNISGNNNVAQIVQRNNSTSSAGHLSTAIITNGDNNTIQTLQTGTGGLYGHSSYVHVKNGRDGNTIDVFQNSDTADHKLTLSIYSNDNIIDVNQTGSTANQAYVLFSHQSVGPTTFTLNQTGGDTYGSTSYVTQYCANAGGCTVTINQ